MKVLALVVLALATMLALGWISLILTAFEASRPPGASEQGVWFAVPFGPPFYVLPVWTVVASGCIVLLFVRKPRP